jgi:cytochrome P450
MIHRTPSVLTMRDKKGHSRRRRLIGEGLSDVALRTYEPAILSRVKQLCDLLAPTCVEGNTSEKSSDESRKWSSPQNMTNWCKLTLFLRLDLMD